MPRESQRRSIRRCEIRRLINRAKSENRSFEDLYLEMYPDETSSTSDTDDCRPLDSLSILSLNETEASQTLESVAQRDRLAAIASLKAGQLRSDVTEDEDSPYVQDLEAIALAHLQRSVKLECIQLWNQDLQQFRADQKLADLTYNENIARKCLGVMREEFYQTGDLERRKRLKMFLAWKDRKLAISAIHCWIIRHRENVVKKRAEDSQDIRAVTVVMGRWHSRAIESQQKKHDFRRFFFATKYGRRWLGLVQQRRITRAIAILEHNYHTYRRERDGKLRRKFLMGWRGCAADTAAMQVTAEDRQRQSQTVRTKAKAHDALSSMYMATAEGMSMEAAADEKYDKWLVLRALSSNGEWRARTRIVQERQEVADEFRTIRDEAKAQRGFRSMRKTAAWGKTMNDNADAYYHRTSLAIGRRAIRTWRTTTASRRGEVPVREPPATPAARMSALRQYQQGQR